MERPDKVVEQVSNYIFGLWRRHAELRERARVLSEAAKRFMAACPADPDATPRFGEAWSDLNRAISSFEDTLIAWAKTPKREAQSNAWSGQP